MTVFNSQKSQTIQPWTAALIAAAWVFSTVGLPADTFTWDGDTDEDWGEASNWDLTPVFVAGNEFVFHSAGAGNLSSFLGASARTIGGLTFNEHVDSDLSIYTYSNNTGTGGANRILTFNNGASNAWITVASGAEGNITIAPGGARVTLNSNLVVDHNGSGNLEIGNWMTATGKSITKDGTGTFTLSSNHASFDYGDLFINAGKVRLAGGNAAGKGVITMTGGHLSVIGTTERQFSNSYNFSGNLTFGDATDTGLINFNNASATGTLTGNTTLHTISNLTLNQAIGEDGDSYSLTKTGEATLTLGSNVNTFSGGLNINGGTVATSNADGRLGAAGGTLSFDGGTLLWTGGVNAGISRDTTVNSGGGTMGVQNSAVQITWNNSIAGVGSFTKTGDGLLYMNSPSNSFAGGLSLNGGIFSVANGDNRIGASGGVVSFDGGTLRFHGSGVDMATSDRTTTLHSGGGTIDVVFADRIITWTGAISGAGGLTKAGDGTLALTRDNDYVGATIVSAGTLLIDGDQSAATGVVTVQSGGTLGGTGTVGGAATVSDGGRLTGGTAGGVGILNFGGDLAMADNSAWLVDLVQDVNGLSDHIQVVDALNIASGATLELGTFSGNWTFGNTYTIATFANRTGTFAGYDDGDIFYHGGNGYEIRYGDTAITLTAVPEPATFGLLAAVLGACFLFRRRRVAGDLN